MIREYLAKRKIKKFILSMSHTLAADYGRSPEYTQGQVKAALYKLGYESDLEEIAIGIFCSEDVAKAFGMDEALIKKYRGYPREHNVGVGSDGGAGAGTFGSDFGDSG